MANRHDLVDWVHEAVNTLGGNASIVQVATHIWSNHENDLKTSGNLFFTWQYDMRWAAQRLRDSGKFKKAANTRRGIWETAG